MDTRIGGPEETTTIHELAAWQAGGDERATRRTLARIGSVAALVGAVVFFVSGLFHPSDSDPNNLPAAFAEYVTSSDWVGVHLAQLAGVALIAVALVALEATFEPGRAAAWARIGSVGAVASAALYAANQGVDGVSNHAADLRWATATGKPACAPSRLRSRCARSRSLSQASSPSRSALRCASSGLPCSSADAILPGWE